MTRILLLEDNADMLNMLAQVLEWGGYEVIPGRSGQVGIAVLEEGTRIPDIIITDLLMPEMGGLEFLDHVRNHPDWVELPVIIMSAHSSSQDRQEAMEHGADDFLVKPFNLEDFKDILAKWEQR
ncbi:MAG: response regulator [Anaerolineae bacterium]|nr:response regulator [Anaerolineae bacterium]